MTLSEEKRWNAVCDRLVNEGYGALAPAERNWVNLRSLIDAVQNGGAISYFFNPSADTFNDCLSALNSVDAGEVRSQLDRVVVLFPDGISSDIGARNAVIDSWPDEDGDSEIDQLLADVDSRLMPLMDDLEQRLASYLKRSGLAT